MAGISQGGDAPFAQQRWVELVNTEDRLIPPYACMEVAADYLYETSNPGTPGGIYRVGVKRPSADNLVNVMFNGPLPIRPNSEVSEPFGFGTFCLPAVSLYTSSTPAAGDSYGSQADSYELKKGNTGFYAIGNAGGTSLSGANVMRVGLSPPRGFSAAKASSSITARSGTTVGTGTADLYSIVSGTLTEGEEVNVVNIFTSVVSSDSWMQVALDDGGNWQVVSVDCGA